ncbi:tetraspanin-1 [Cyprinodon tularosa]|uniref:tetraspanin-1 n=1 Tax=Cyprinodon tularosa TaxID=77115 RepID=UPI0018E25B8E|nr:tetraspanin-1 [Cyprinodon tularosa]
MSCFTFTKLLTVLLLLLVFLIGLTLLALGIWVTVDGNHFLHLLWPFSKDYLTFINVGLFCIAMGTALVVLGLLGSCGAHKESKFLLLTFFSIIMVVFLTEVASAVMVLVYSSFAKEIFHEWAIPALQNDYGIDPVVTEIWNATMTELKCCGYSNFTDFMGSEFEEQSGNVLPATCCINSDPCSPTEAARLPVQGCFDHIVETLREESKIVGGIAAGLGLLEIAAMSIAMYLFSRQDEKVS